MTGRRAIALVARRELRERLRSRAFLFSTLFLLVVVGGSSAAPALLDREHNYDVAVTAPAPHGLATALRREAKPFDATVRLHVVASAAAGRRALAEKRVDAVLLLDGDRLLFRSTVDSKLAAVADGAVRAVRRHLPPAPELATATIEPAPAAHSDAEVAVAVYGSVLMILTLSVYGNWVLVGVVEEKANRVVELVLSTVRPRHLLAGKVIGIGLLGLAQLTLVAAVAGALLAAGVFDAPPALGGSIALVLPWFALGFALYAVAFATAGALASGQQNAETAGQPVTLTLVGSYIASYVAVSAAPDGVLAHVLTVFPLTSAFVLPARTALGGVPPWEHALALALAVGSIYALVRLAGRIYAQGLLRSGPHLGARILWRLARRA